MLTRRNFVKFMGLGSAGFLLPLPKIFANTTASGPTSNFLQIIVPGGLDTQYFFDARPLEFTRQNLIHNYNNSETLVFNGINNESCYISSVAEPLLAYKNYFTLINGVHCAEGFDGHSQNLNYLFTGSPFGGASFLPFLKSDESLLSYLNITSNVNIATNNSQSSIRLDQTSGRLLTEIARSSVDFNEDSPLFQYILNQAKRNASGDGVYTDGVRNFISGLLASPRVRAKLKQTEVSNAKDVLTQRLDLMKTYFDNNVTNNCVLQLGYLPVDIDAHGESNLKVFATKTAPAIVQDLVKIIEYLRKTTLKDGRSLMDSTTFVFTSEFGRTMKIADFSVDATGSNHNPKNNSILIGGKGIKCGQVIGQSDWQEPQEKLSPAHMSVQTIDPILMGRPYDFKNQTILKDYKPETYNKNEYISVDNYVNTVLDLFNADPTAYRFQDRQKTQKYPSLSGVLK